MSEEGRAEVARHVPRGTLAQLDTYVALLIAGAARQNLIAPSTVADLWRRHILDSVQLAALATAAGTWVDVGSGAGLPGMVTALVTDRPTLLIGPRRLRATFLAETVTTLGLADRVEVRAERCERVAVGEAAGIISARAVAALPALLAMAEHLGDTGTQWLLPKGRTAAMEVAAVERSWQGEFRLVPSLTDSQAMIVDARHVRRTGGWDDPHRARQPEGWGWQDDHGDQRRHGAGGDRPARAAGRLRSPG